MKGQSLQLHAANLAGAFEIAKRNGPKSPYGSLHVSLTKGSTVTVVATNGFGIGAFWHSVDPEEHAHAADAMGEGFAVNIPADVVKSVLRTSKDPVWRNSNSAVRLNWTRSGDKVDWALCCGSHSVAFTSGQFPDGWRRIISDTDQPDSPHVISPALAWMAQRALGLASGKRGPGISTINVMPVQRKQTVAHFATGADGVVYIAGLAADRIQDAAVSPPGELEAKPAAAAPQKKKVAKKKVAKKKVAKKAAA